MLTISIVILVVVSMAEAQADSELTIEAKFGAMLYQLWQKHTTVVFFSIIIINFVFISVRLPPSIEGSPLDGDKSLAYFRTGEVVMLRCNTRGVPRPKYQYFC